MDIKPLYWIMIIVVLISCIFLFIYTNNKINEQYTYNCFENDTIKNVTFRSYNCKEVDCVEHKCIKFIYELTKTGWMSSNESMWVNRSVTK